VIYRHGKTIEQIKLCSSGSVQEMVFWNNSPNIEALIPVEQMYTHQPRTLEVSGNYRPREIDLNPFKVGDQVYSKPPSAKCATAKPAGRGQDWYQTEQ